MAAQHRWDLRHAGQFGTSAECPHGPVEEHSLEQLIEAGIQDVLGLENCGE
jgi:hypothetical protein